MRPKGCSETKSAVGLSVICCQLVSVIPPKSANFCRPYRPARLQEVETSVFAKVVTAFRSGSWDECRLPLAHLPADDRSRDFLLVQIVSQSYQPPSGWSGVIRMDSK